MRRTFLFFLVLAASPAPAVAGIAGTAHEFEYGSVDPEGSNCASICHSYLEGGARLVDVQQAWQTALDNEGTVGAVAAMCASCHRSGGGYGATMQAAFSDNNVYHPESHGQRMSLANLPTGTSSSDSGLPRVGSEAGIFQCSSCHDPHNDAYRPFLRVPLGELCARCHTARNFVSGQDSSGSLARAGAWQPETYGGASNPGSHPVGEDVAEGRPGAYPVTIGSSYRIPLSPVPGLWSAGPHLSGGADGGVTCVTCHAVHGAAPDADDTAAQGSTSPPHPSFLAMAQSAGNVSGYARPVVNGDGGTNVLCESCHGVGNNPVVAPGDIAWSDPERNVHPGRTGNFSHPTDSYPSGTDGGVDRFPAGWPAGLPVIAGSRVSPVPICESCHAPHAAAGIAAGRTDILQGGGAYLLRAPIGRTSGSEPLCDACHRQSLAGHHPVNKVFDSRGVAYLKNVKGMPSDRLACATCHWVAHSWTRPGRAGLDPAWRPADNGRRESRPAEMYNPEMSVTCMDCHYSMDGDPASISPTMGSSQTVIVPSDAEMAHYQISDRSMGTHYIGLIHEDGEWREKPLVDIFDGSRTWRDQSPGGKYREGLAPGWARFGGENRTGGRVLVCESCHELEPGKNGGFRHLLLAPYEEGRNGMNEYPGDDDGRDILCEACHGVLKGSHPTTGSEVSRTGEPTNCAAGWVRKEIMGYATTDGRGAGCALSCDSCHQPHDANSNGATFILDVPPTFLSPDGQNSEVTPGDLVHGYAGSLSSTYPEADGSGGTYATPHRVRVKHTALCLQCHDH